MKFLDRLKGVLRRKSASDTPRQSVAEALQTGGSASALAPVKAQTVGRPPFEKFYSTIAIAAAAYMAADLTILYFRDKMIPTQAAPGRPATPIQVVSKMRTQYNIITDRNIFNSDGLIPPGLSQPQGDEKDKGNMDGPAVPTSLPINLVGTIVHGNPGKSVATMEIKGGKVLPFIPNDEIEGVGTLLRVERRRAIFRNSQNGRNEYVEIKDKGGISFGIKSNETTAAAPTAPTDFSLPRTEVNNYIKNLPELLQQARAEPNILPGGKIDGFKVMDIMPGSLYEKLGIRVGDVIKGVNGEVIDSPAKAMELYQKLRTSNKIQLELERNGNKEMLNYNIN